MSLFRVLECFGRCSGDFFFGVVSFDGLFWWVGLFSGNGWILLVVFEWIKYIGGFLRNIFVWWVGIALL